MRDRSLPLVLTLVAAQLVVMLDSSILNVALPSIAEDLGLTAVGTAWVLNAYFLTFGGLLLISGRAADVFGRRRMFLIGAAVLAAGSVLGGFASSDTVLVTARLVQGAGSAMLSPAAMSVILATFAGASRARPMSWWGAASTAGGALGVAVGGLLTGALGWQSVMFVTAAAAILVGVAGWLHLRRDHSSTRRHFDATGATLVTAAAAAVVFAVLSVPHAGIVSFEVLAASGIAIVAGVGFVLVERRSPDPVLPLPGLRDSRVAGGIFVNLLGGAARIACFVLVALLIQQVLDYDPAMAGLAMLPTSIAGFAVSTLVLPRVLARFGPEKVAVMGLLMLVVAHVLFATIDTGVPYVWRVLPVLIIAATGVAFSFTPTTLVIAEGMAARNAGVSSGLASSTAQIGGAIGIAVFGAVDALNRAAALSEGGSAVDAAQAGLSAAHLAAAAAAALAAVIAVLTWPALRRRRGSRTEAAPAAAD
ncbi:MFS transporter [Microbacterium flavescens]|uniref:MFS transporter n=1 Tax=Microbacterium flavescens TaxID=69366 RepID=UPI001BDF39E0|nr:MFS transporter [Microbacterium flavescens]